MAGSLAQPKAKTGYASPDGIAELHSDVGNEDHAFEWLDTAYHAHDCALVALRTNFAMDSLRPDPRSAELVRKVGFPPPDPPRWMLESVRICNSDLEEPYHGGEKGAMMASRTKRGISQCLGSHHLDFSLTQE